jgi:citrate lyase subunit beta/citryl-CoA lyase
LGLNAFAMSDLLRNACTFLFVPATQSERLHKALASQADMVIADWEDAVAPADKAQAREALVAAVQTLSAAQRARLLVRINAAGTAWFDGDVQALARLVAQGIGGAVVPKSESPAQLAVIAEQAGAACALVALVESVAGIDALDALARAPQVQRLAFGHLDFQVDAGMQCEADEVELLPIRMALVMASRRAGKPVDGVTVETKDATRMEGDARRALRMGFGGKLCIHPAQVPLANGVFAPSAAEVAHAQAVVQAIETAQGGVCVVGGKMVDAPVLQLAQRTLRRYAWAQQRT